MISYNHIPVTVSRLPPVSFLPVTEVRKSLFRRRARRAARREEAKERECGKGGARAAWRQVDQVAVSSPKDGSRS